MQATLTGAFFLLAGITVRAQAPDALLPVATAGENSNFSANENLPDALHPQTPASEELTLDHRFKLYLHSLVSPAGVIGVGFGAGIGQWRNEPPEWGQGGDGYGRRFASGFGRREISESIRFGVAAVDGEDPRFQPSHEQGIWPRTLSAVEGTFASSTDRGTRIPAYSRFAGTYGAAFIANTWYPQSRSNATHALERGSSALGSSVAWHLFREFWPDIRHALHHNK